MLALAWTHWNNMCMEQDLPKMDPKRAKAVLRKIKHYSNSTNESIAATGLEGDELIAFMGDEFVESITQEFKPESVEFKREMGRKALFDVMMQGVADPRQLDVEARSIGYKRNQSAVDWIMRVASEGARHHLEKYEAASGEEDEAADQLTPTEVVQPVSADEAENDHETTAELVDLDDTIRKLGLDNRLNPKYAQGLLVAYDKVQSSFDPQVVANTVGLALEDVLRRHKFHFGDAQTMVRRFSEAYLYGLQESMEAPNFTRLTKHAWQMAAKDLLDDGSVLPALESTVATQLETMYPIPKK